MLPILLLFIFGLYGEVLCGKDYPHVKIPDGDIQGIYLKTPTGKTYEAYLGVPYAKPPFGDLRFKEAQQVTPWIGSYNASAFGSDCLQFSHFGYTTSGSEDCLFINIYKPLGKSNKDGSPFDVIVHIHGGAFMFFSPRDFKPDKLMDHNIVYTSFNYRLGPLGFLSTGDKILPGNLGLKDQVFALKWIRDNINYFGGAPDRVTLTGVSAGGASVHYHYLSPLSRGLFSKGVSGSGVALTPWALTENAPEKTKLIASRLGCPTNDSALMVKCLIQRPAQLIVAQVPLFLTWMYNPFSPFGPVIEPEDADSPFLTRHPYDIIKDGSMQHLPWICSYNSEEGLYPAAEFIEDPKLSKELEDNWYEYLPHLLDYNFTVRAPTVEQKIHITKVITMHYLKGQKPTESVNELVQLFGDRLFSASIVQASILQGSVSKAPVYLYRFGYRGKYSASEAFSHSTTNFGVCHGDDSGYIYEGGIYNMCQTEDDRTMGKRMINLLISFTKRGVPEFFNNEPLPAIKDGLPNIRYLDVVSPNKAIIDTKSDLAELNFWSSLPLREQYSSSNQLKDEL